MSAAEAWEKPNERVSRQESCAPRPRRAGLGTAGIIKDESTAIVFKANEGFFFFFLPLLDQRIHSFFQQMFLVVTFSWGPIWPIAKESSEREQERLRWKGLRVFLRSLSAFLWWVITIWSKIHLPRSITCPQRYKADGSSNGIIVIWIWGIIKNFSNSS